MTNLLGPRTPGRAGWTSPSWTSPLCLGRLYSSTSPSQHGWGKLSASSLAPRQQGVPFCASSWHRRQLLLGFTGRGWLGRRGKHVPACARALTRCSYVGHVHLGGGTKALWLSPRAQQSPAGGLPRALRRPWIFIVSENGPFMGSRWKV